MGNNGMTRMAIADVEARVRLPCRQVVVELPRIRAVGIDAVVTIRVGRQVTAPETFHAFPVEPVAAIVPRGHVLNHHTIGSFYHLKGVAELEVTIHNHAIAVPAPDSQVRGAYRHSFVINTRSNRDHVSGPGRVDRRLYRGILLRHMQNSRLTLVHPRHHLPRIDMHLSVADRQSECKRLQRVAKSCQIYTSIIYY